jgi:aryl sulfotransferase
MRILQSGMEKSGNYWLYKIIQSTLRRSSLPTTTFIQTQPIYPLAKTWELSYQEQADTDVLDIEDTGCFYRISSIFRMPVLDLDAYLQPATHVWTHSDFCQRCYNVFPKFDKVVYIIRDPRDVALSMARFQFTPYMRKYYPSRFTTQDAFLQASFHRYMKRWTQHVGAYLRHAGKLNVYLLFYERLLHDFDREMTGLLAYLDLTATRDLLNGIKADTDFETMRQKNPSHVSRGEANQWVSQLTEPQKALALHHAGKMLSLLGYPTQDDEIRLPALPSRLSPELIEQAMQPAQPPVTQRLKKIARRVMR